MALLLAVLGLVAVVAAAVHYGEIHWRSGTRELRDQIEAAKLPIERKVFDGRELERAPAPVQRYVRAVLADGHPFASDQRDVTRRPGFRCGLRHSACNHCIDTRTR